MKLVRSLVGLRATLSRLPRPLGLVPTMGALHAGHLALVRRAAQENEASALTIFVNPTQFGPDEDFDRYPRTLERDLELADESGVDIVFAPAVDQIYPAGFSTTVSVGGLSERWEGAHRPGHFDGVATVVARLLLLFVADRAYFGEKDYQQLQVITRMVSDLAIPTEIIGFPTVREPDGLAMSSRNAFLSAEDRPRAIVLYQALCAAAKLASRGERRVSALEHAMQEVARSAALDVDYLAIVDSQSLNPIAKVAAQARAIGAVRVGTVRLIDNVAVVCPAAQASAK